MELTVVRAVKRKTQWDLRVATGINQGKISLIERGYVMPTAEEKQKIAEALGVNVNQIDWPNHERKTA